MEKQTVMLHPKRVSFTQNDIRIADRRKGSYQIPYRELVLAYLRVPGQESGLCQEPEIEEITEDMDGELVLYDCRRSSFHLGTEQLNRKAGRLLAELLARAPYLLAGGSAWLDKEDEEGFLEACRMVAAMRECV